MSQPFAQPSDVEVIRVAVDNALNETHTCLPAIIESFDATTQTAKVNPSIRRIVYNGDKIVIPPIINVPVVFPSSGGYSITFPVAAGDEVLLVFSERSIDMWLQSGGVQDPLDRRKHDYSDAIAIIGLHSAQKAISDYSDDGLVIRSDDGTEKITLSQGSVDIDIAGTGGAVYNSDGSVVFKNGAIITALGGFINGPRSGSIPLDGHKHLAGTPPGDTGVSKL